MFNLCDIDHPATSVELSAYCNFFNMNEKSLVVCGANIMRVFRLVPEVPFKNVVPPRKDEGKKSDIDKSLTVKLVNQNSEKNEAGKIWVNTMI